jgi:hypothetical protein
MSWNVYIGGRFMPFLGSMIGVSIMVATGATAATPSHLAASAEVGRRNGFEMTVIAYPDLAWQCRDAHCSGRVDGRPAATMKACREVARKMSGVRAFKTGDRKFDAAELLTCNNGKVLPPAA